MWFRTRPLDPTFASAQQTGFTLVELMVALVLGMLIVLAAFSTYVSQRIASSLGKQTSLLQEEGSRALDAAARDLRQAGDFNCLNAAHTNVINTGTTLADISGMRGFSTTTEIANSGLTGAAAVNTAITSTGGSGNATQVLAISGTLESMAIMTTAAGVTATKVTVKPQDFAADQTVVVSDCVNASMLKVSAYTYVEGTDGAPGANTLTFTHALGADYAASTSVSRIATIWWFFGTPKFGSTSWPRGLYRVDGDTADASNGHGFKLMATRVQNLAFTFDRDTDTTPDGVINDRKKTQNQVGTTMAAWKKVRRVKLEVLLKSDVDVLPDAQAYYFNGEKVTPTDKRMYLPLELSTTLRNMY